MSHSVSMIIVPDLSHLASTFVFQIFGRLDSLVSALKFLQIESPLLFRRLSQLNLHSLIYGTGRLGPSVLTSDVHLSSLPALRCFACLEALSSVVRQLNIGSFSFALNHANLDPSIPLQSFSCSSMPLFALDYLHLESVLLLKSSARLGSSLFVLDLLHLCVIFLLRSYARLDLPTVVSDHVHNLSPATSSHVCKGVK